MGTFAFRLPDIGEGVVEGEIVEWMVSVGDSVKEDDPILSVMTDKATVEIPSPVDGKVTSMKGEAGEILAVGQVCIEFEVEGDGNTEESGSEPESEPEPTPEVKQEVTPEPKKDSPPASPPPVVSTPAVPGLKPLASPAVRKRARGRRYRFDCRCRFWSSRKNHACRPRFMEASRFTGCSRRTNPFSPLRNHRYTSDGLA